MTRRQLVSAGISLTALLAITYAVRIAVVSGKLLFDSAWWVVLVAPFVGMFAAAFTTRQEPAMEGNRVLRHDGAAILEHWTHGLGTAVLLLTGIPLGFLFVPQLLERGIPVWTAMNIHFVGAVAFLFGTFYYAANTVISAHRFREHLPTRNAFAFTVQHYGHLLGVKSCEMPPEDKYYESEKMAYLMALGGSMLIIVTGIFKALAHVIDIPNGVMGLMTFTHDAATIVMLLFFVAHVFFAAIAPFSWPVLGSMFHGYISREHAEKEHAAWLSRLSADPTNSPARDTDAA